MTPPRRPGPATAFAAALLTEFVRVGVRDVVVAPGSRSQALALAAAALARAGHLRLRVRIDERGAGFLALGIAREEGAPVLVITTSGTAVANLHPAVLEAHHAGVPLIVVTADRPEELRGIGSNQTTTHVGMFAGAVRSTWDVGAPTGEPGEVEAAAALARAVVDSAGTRSPGPVHLNVAFTEPLSGPWEAPATIESVPPSDPPSTRRVVHTLDVGPRTAVIAGSGAGPRAEAVARELGAVLFAEVVSGAHFGPNLVVPYREVIRDEAFQEAIERIVVFGRPTLSREVPWLVGRTETIVVRSRGAEEYNPGHAVDVFADEVDVVGIPDPAAVRAWVGSWVAASRAWLEAGEDVAPEVFATPRAKAERELDAVRRPVTRRALVEAVWRSSWPHDRLVVAASRLVRELDRVAPGKAITVHANRGLAGIDGTTATAIGVAFAQQRDAGAAGVTRLLTGDLAFFHDVGSLAFAPDDVRPRILVVVGNDGGGTIFDALEVGSLRTDGGALAEDFDRVLLTPQSASIEQLAAAYGWDFRRVSTRGELDPALSACAGPTIVEVPLLR